MKIAIWGAGAVGIGLASTLARESDGLRILVRNPDTRHQLARDGMRRTGLFGEVEIPPDQFEVIANAAALVDDPPDWLLVCTKAFSTEDVARELAPVATALAPYSALVLCQNGWGNETPFLGFWPEARLFHARVITGFRFEHDAEGPRTVEITAHAAPIALGSLFGVDAGVLEPLAEAISRGGIPTETGSDMRGVLWAKMLYNCALNPLGALAGRRYGELVENPTTRALIEEVVGEIFAVLAAAEVSMAWPNAAAYLDTFYATLIPPTAAHESSMLQDLRARRATEIEALAGAVERLAVEVDVATPVVSALAELVRAAEATGLRRERSG